MGKKSGTEKIFLNKNGKIIVGTTNSKTCTAAYVRVETWITVEDSLETSIDAIRRRFRAKAYNISKIYFEGLKTLLFDYHYPQTKEADKIGKKSFIGIEITLIPQNNFKFNNDFIFTCNQFGNTLFDILETLDEYFEMSSSKK